MGHLSATTTTILRRQNTNREENGVGHLQRLQIYSTTKKNGEENGVGHLKRLHILSDKKKACREENGVSHSSAAATKHTPGIDYTYTSVRRTATSSC